MQPLPNRMGLGMRPSFGQGPSMGALAAQQQMLHHQPQAFVPPTTQSRPTSLFIGSISAGISDGFMNQLLSACGPVKAFKRLITPAGKPQGFGFAEYEDPDSALRAMSLLNNVELPSLEDGAANKKLLVKADEKTKMFLDVYNSNRMKTDDDEVQIQQAKAKVIELVQQIVQSTLGVNGGAGLEKEKYVIPPHLHDLQEADLPETQRGLVISEIAQFRERAAKREREKMRDVQQQIPVLAPSGPKQREWGRPQYGNGQPSSDSPGRPVGSGPQSYQKPVGFVPAESTPSNEDMRQLAGKGAKTDEELEHERKEARHRDEENSFRDRERRYEPRERTRISALERSLARVKAVEEAERRDRVEMGARLEVWDDDESDEMFYADRSRWRHLRSRRLTTEEAADAESRDYEARETENLRKESEAFLARQMEEMQALQEEQRNAGMLLDDGAPVKLNVSLVPVGAGKPADGVSGEKKILFTADEEEEEAAKKKRAPLVKLDFSAAEGGEKAKERLEKIRLSVPRDKETLFKAKVRWDGISDLMIDRKFEPMVKRLMVKFLGELEDDDLVMFVLEHLKDHKGPQKLVEGLEPVLEEESNELAISVWRQVIFESMAYGEGLHTERTMVE